MWPFVGWDRLLPKTAPEMREKLLGFALNRAVIAARIHATFSLACPG